MRSERWIGCECGRLGIERAFGIDGQGSDGACQLLRRSNAEDGLPSGGVAVLTRRSGTDNPWLLGKCGAGRLAVNVQHAGESRGESVVVTVK